MFIESKRRIDVALDTYPLGAMAYRMLTGSEPAQPTYFVPGAPPPLAQLILRMLSPDRRQRPNILDVRELVKSMIGATEESVVQPIPAVGRARRPTRRRSWAAPRPGR